MKVAMVVPKFPALSETFILNQITGLIDKGIDVEILAFGRGDTKTYHEIVDHYKLMDRVHYIGGDIPHNKLKRVLKIIPAMIKNLGRINIKDILETVNFFKYGLDILSLRCLYALTSITEKKSYDIIHCQYGPHGVEALILKELGLLDGEIITSFRGFDITRSYTRSKQGYDLLYKKGRFFLPVCNYFKEILISYKCPENKIRVLYSGINTEKFIPNSRKKKKHNYTNILSVARLEEKKGLKYAIEAVSRLIKQGKNIYYTIIGEGSLKNELLTLIRSLDVEDWIKLVGKKNHEDILKYLDASDIFLAPSVTGKDGNQEGIPNSIKEAMLMEVPVISTYHSGIPELIDNNITGYLVPERDSVALCQKINYVIENKNIQEKVVKKAAIKVKDKFSNAKLNDSLIEIYKQSISF